MQGMFVELQGAFDNGIEVQRLLLRRGGTGEFEEVLNDASGAASLTMRHFELALGAFINARAVAQQLADSENSGKGIVQFVSDARQHLAHGGKFFRLNKLLFETLELGNIAPGDD